MKCITKEKFEALLQSNKDDNQVSNILQKDGFEGIIDNTGVETRFIKNLPIFIRTYRQGL